MKKNGITTQEIYELVDRKINQVNDSIVRLESKFDTLEAGRLSAIEKDFANFKGELQGKSGMISGIIAIAVSVAIAVINRFF